MQKNVSEQLVVGVRWFQLRGDGMLMGAAGKVWESRYYTAECHMLEAPYPNMPSSWWGTSQPKISSSAQATCRNHLAFGGCTCGLYIQSLDLPISTRYESQAYPIKAIAVGWGMCFLHSSGARVEKCRLESLQINLRSYQRFITNRPDPVELCKLLEAHYEIPVTTEAW